MSASSPRPTVAAHTHRFGDADWPFADPPNTVSFTTVGVLKGERPIREVYHDDDGDWQFLCGTTQATEDLRIVCMGCAFEREPALRALADLPCGWMAIRDSDDTPWQRSAYEADED
jgi:hypothetical protein